MIEPTNVCNLKCPLCPTGAGTLKRPTNFLDFDTYRRIIDEVKRDTCILLLWNLGESFLHRDFISMVRYADKADLWTYASTNGHYLEHPETIIASGLCKLLVSLDGATPETYEAYRRSGNFHKVIQGMTKLAETKSRLKSLTPEIHLQFIVMRHNEHEVPEIYRLARQCGVDRLTLKTVQIYDDSDIDIWLPEQSRLRRYRVVKNAGDRRHFAMKHGYRNRCKWLWNLPVINAGREVAVCCFDKDVDFIMGRIDRQSFREIWHSPRYQAFRRSVLQDRGQFEMCRNCGEGLQMSILNQDVNMELDHWLEKFLPAYRQKRLAEEKIDDRIRRAAGSRLRKTGRRDFHGTIRTGVAGMSFGKGPRRIEKLGKDNNDR